MNFKIYQFLKIKSFLKTNNIIFLFSGINLNQNSLIQLEQNFIKLNFVYYKVYNELTIKLFKNSTFYNFNKLISGPFFFFRTKKKIMIDILDFENSKFLFFLLLALKFNNRIYSILQIKNLYSINYKNNLVVLYQFLITSIKKCFTIK
jgi:hypothetical protein